MFTVYVGMCLYILPLLPLYGKTVFLSYLTRTRTLKKTHTNQYKAKRLKLPLPFQTQNLYFRTPIYLSFIHCFLKLQYILIALEIKYLWHK